MREGCWACADAAAVEGAGVVAAAVDDGDGMGVGDGVDAVVDVGDDVDGVVDVGDDVVDVGDVGDGVAVVAVDGGVVLDAVEPEPAGLGLEPDVFVAGLVGVRVPCGLSGNWVSVGCAGAVTGLEGGWVGDPVAGDPVDGPLAAGFPMTPS
jgi:hypothetical protein